MGSRSYARAVYVIACYMIERHGDRAGDVLEGFVAANQSEEDVEAKALWADVRVAVRVLTSEAARPLTVSSSRSRSSRSSASSGS
jgi:hypothetical protein